MRSRCQNESADGQLLQAERAAELHCRVMLDRDDSHLGGCLVLVNTEAGSTVARRPEPFKVGGVLHDLHCLRVEEQDKVIDDLGECRGGRGEPGAGYLNTIQTE